MKLCPKTLKLLGFEKLKPIDSLHDPLWENRKWGVYAYRGNSMENVIINLQNTIIQQTRFRIERNLHKITDEMQLENI